MRTCFLILLTISFSSISANQALEQGKTLGKSKSSGAWGAAQAVQAHELTPPDQQPSSFDSEQARKQMEDQTPPQSEVMTFLNDKNVQQNELRNRGFEGNEDFFALADAAIQQAEGEHQQTTEDPILSSTDHTCHRFEAPFEKTVTRSLNVDVERIPPEFKQVKKCHGHSSEKKHDSSHSAHRDKESLERAFRGDSTVSWHRVEIQRSIGHRRKVTASYGHADNAQACDNYHLENVKVKEGSHKEHDTWTTSSPSFYAYAQGPNCTLSLSKCIDNTPSKEINGISVNRKCWKEQLTFLCTKPQTQTPCPYASNPNCELIKEACKERSKYGCALWEQRYRCYNSLTIKTTSHHPEVGTINQESSYEPNNSFTNVVTTLSVFDEIGKEINATSASNLSQVQIFQGKSHTCTKNVADNVLYDCCFNYDGLATKVKLAECNPEELNLRDLRKRGMCHYVGKYANKFVGVKSSTTHTFCCFKSKLSRVLQEQARGQLSIGWGSPKEPDCRGLFQDEISRLDFGKMDLSELHSAIPTPSPQEFKERVGAFEKRIRDRLDQKGTAVDLDELYDEIPTDPSVHERINSFMETRKESQQKFTKSRGGKTI